MEIKNRNKKKKETLAGIFRKYMAFFCASSAVLLLFSLSLIMTPFLYDGFLLPANYVEHRVQELLPELEKKEKITASNLPSGCTYAVYDEKGIFFYGDLGSQEKKTAWRSYEQQNKYAADGGFYNFAVLKNGNICVIKYGVKVRYSLERLNDVLPPPEVLPFLIFLVLFFLDGYLLSRRFGRRMERELRSLGEATEKISREDLEFQTEPSDIREIDRVLDSLEALKNALKKSLKEQWDAEQTKNRQLSALAHDIKTPLTVVRGNAELLTESDLAEADQACVHTILQNAGQMERYLSSMRQVLKGKEEEKPVEEIPAAELAADFCDSVRQLAAVREVPVSFDLQECPGTDGRKMFPVLVGSREELLRAWGNLVSNALEHTDPKRGVHVAICRKNAVETDAPADAALPGSFLYAAVRDYGRGFSKKDLHSHQGLGLSIACQFVEKQGGFLRYKNVREGFGAEVSLWLRLR